LAVISNAWVLKQALATLLARLAPSWWWACDGGHRLRADWPNAVVPVVGSCHWAAIAVLGKRLT